MQIVKNTMEFNLFVSSNRILYIVSDRQMYEFIVFFVDIYLCRELEKSFSRRDDYTLFTGKHGFQEFIYDSEIPMCTYKSL